MIKYIGKSLFIKVKERKILVISDLHIGKVSGENEARQIVARQLQKELFSELNEIIDKIGKVSEIIILGDLKHEFGGNGTNERENLVNLLDYLSKFCGKIIIIRGNHDTFITLITKNRKDVNVVDRYVFENYCFLHGDREFIEIYDKKIRYWIMGHLHPSIKLEEGVKSEQYKCFLTGEYMKRKIIILPSFDNSSYGSNIIEMKSNLVWPLNLLEFEVKIVSDNHKILDFGKLKNLT